MSEEFKGFPKEMLNQPVRPMTPDTQRGLMRDWDAFTHDLLAYVRARAKAGDEYARNLLDRERRLGAATTGIRR